VVRSAYVAVFQIPFLPERILSAGRGAVLGQLLEASGLDPECAGTYRHALQSPEEVSASLAWYRALLRTRAPIAGPSQVPTLYVWSSADQALGRSAAERTAAHVDAPYRFVVLDGVTHWIPEMAAEPTAQLVIDHTGGNHRAEQPGGSHPSRASRTRAVGS
jgi:pimeloyl-ACP methyl ester carboxylesterase